MKYITLALVILAAIGCGHNEFDVSPAQVSDHQAVAKPEGMDQPHLPPEAFRSGIKVKKGDRLPDGTISDRAGTLVAGSDGEKDKSK